MRLKISKQTKNMRKKEKMELGGNRWKQGRGKRNMVLILMGESEGQYRVDWEGERMKGGRQDP